MDDCTKKIVVGGKAADSAGYCGCYVGGQEVQDGCYIDEDDIVQCPGGGDAGGQGTFTATINVGPGLGVFSFYYQAYTIPDRFIISGAASYDTGLIGGSSTVSIPKTSESAYIQVTVLAPLSGTAWVYSVGCTG